MDSNTTPTTSSFDQFVKQKLHTDLLRFFTAGSVDDGKSTLIGRLLVDSQNIYEDQLDDLKKDSGVDGGINIDFAQITDGLRAEREQGITIDVAYRFFSTSKRQFIIADTPGHEQYTRNMATGASTASLAIILIDARKGVLPQSRRHSFIASLLGVNHMVIAINKMDLVDFSERRFNRICDEFSEFVAPLQIRDVCFIPISALYGDNVVYRSNRMPWYTGPHLLGHLETVHISSDRNLTEMRFPIQHVIRTSDGFRGYAGYVASGVIRVADRVTILPSQTTTYVKSIHSYKDELEGATTPMSVTMTLADDVDVSRGDMLVHPGYCPRIAHVIDARIVWMSDRALDVNSSYLVKHTSQTVRAVIREMRYRINFSNFEKEATDRLTLNDIGAVTLACHQPLFCDPYKRNRATGSLILIDPLTNETVAAGMITAINPDELSFAADAGEEQTIGTSEKPARSTHRPAALWVANNFTLQNALLNLLSERNCRVCVVNEQVTPALAGQILRILNSSGLISIWSGLALDRNALQNAIDSLPGATLIDADNPIVSTSQAATSTWEYLEQKGIVFPQK